MRVILAEDSTLLREGLVRLLTEEGHQVLAAVGDGAALLDAVGRDTPDVVVADVRMPPTHTDEGLLAALEIRRRDPGIGVLVLSQYVERRYATELIAEGTEGIGYLLKDRVAQVDEFLAALDQVGAGGTALDPEVVRRLLASSSRTDPLSTLSAREQEVLHQMAQGRTNASIAAALHVSQSAVEKHVNSVFAKLGLFESTGYNRRVLAILRYLQS
ncbi:response regulator transcription factor [Actinoalloteichus hymeniacidonis]|uniref:Two component transcriptional regulator, LuxR family n=1 Tax=Actinoalloteichus hymeniacidonis TaxID=340345 RepID=A0AAC9HMI5_9PSEU|nr:response regulator transcription factor [Actinoalloteichus hymeniacidonis]AOS61854.1 two component transcriptional regulator, LuxR family [Actinoalloteichus hymeniacidonis]MBB5910126.1 DNA-binding NarL/FixJ family response regulator [Actinoalloteichus hymeniacidonis]